MKKISENFHLLVVKFSVYLKRLVLLMTQVIKAESGSVGSAPAWCLGTGVQKRNQDVNKRGLPYEI